MEGWLIGDFSSIIKENYEILYLGVLVVALCYLYANKFTIVGLGTDTAQSLGVNPKRITYLGLILVAITSTVVVLTAGDIPFLGLIIPNVVSMFFGDNLKKPLSYTVIVGAFFLLIQSVLVFAYGDQTYQVLNAESNFILSVGMMLVFAFLMYQLVFKKESKSIYVSLLVGLLLGTLFRSFSSFVVLLIT